MRLVSWDSIVQARESGTSDFRIITSLLFPKIANVLPGLLILQMGFLMAVEFLLTFLGVGLPPSTPSWGNMAVSYQSMEWWGWATPLASIILLTAGLYMLGSWLLDRSEDKAL